ncbi:MAG: hypothetical protein NT128_00440 [Proteobacteria bacterium]|nr:hypothetical protein [Pseudomonadota bacterium]
MKKNNNIPKVLTVAFMAIGSVSQVYAMDEVDDGGSPAARSRNISRANRV